MNKTDPRWNDPRWNDPRVTPSCGNVFIDLGFEPAEAEIMALRAEVMIRLEQHLKAQGWTQTEAAKRLGITQPRVSKLLKGVWQDFSLDMLLTLAARAGLHPKLKLAAQSMAQPYAPSQRGHGRILLERKSLGLAARGARRR